ncbi:Alpha/Beta hydrolase protein [Mycena capillaripes]|nr:Alpha/Beta hydrolase protein [Mycena capillaripes]
MNQFLDISYIPGTSDSLRSLDLHVPPRSARNSPVIVFVHGGAWGGSCLRAGDGIALSRPRTQLPPHHQKNKFFHPGHAEDTVNFLEFFNTWQGIPDIFDPTGRSTYFLGHSAGAHILTSVPLDSSLVSPTLTPSPAVLQAVKGIALAEGIYDIDLLLARFPTYRDWFIAAAFGDRQSYPDASTTILPLRKGLNTRWLVIHSTGDTLVDQPQSDAIYAHLRTLYGASADEHVAQSVDQLDKEHSDVLAEPLFIELIRTFVQ